MNDTLQPDMPRDPWALQRWAYSTSAGAPVRKALLGMLAMMADSQTARCEAKQATLAQGCEVSVDTIQRHLAAMEAAGLVERRRQGRSDGRGRRSDEYLLLAPWVVEWPDGQPTKAAIHGLELGDQNRTTPATKTATGAVAERPQRNGQLHGENGRRRAAREGGQLVRFGGKSVSEESWAKAKAALDEYNGATGQHVGALTGQGQPSEAAKRVLGRIKDWPALTVEEHSDIIARTLASKWWGDSAPTVGVVYGPKVFEDNMTRDPALSNGRGGGGGSYGGDLDRFD